jgi:hypothetical protein
METKPKNGIIHLSIPNVNFECPHCGKKYSDREEKYFDKCNKNKNSCTEIKCQCERTFGVTYNYKGNAVGFKLTSKK